MPRKYKRKPDVVPRQVNWTEDTLARAFEELDKKQKGINEISRTYGIPSRTLRRRYETRNQKMLSKGKYPVLGFENEKNLVAHILKLADAGFPPERSAIRQIAFQFAEKMGLKHNFNNETKMAGTQWLKSFLERNPEIILRQNEGLSIERVKGINGAEVANFFDLLSIVLTENDLLDAPDRIFSMDKTGLQLNNEQSLTTVETEEAITVVACCNGIGNFLPPVLIIKGSYKISEFQEGLPPFSKVYMQKKSAYISNDIFYKWLTEHFIPLKPPGKVVLIIDGHTSHSSTVCCMLEIAQENDVILLCLHSHTTSALQPFVFGPFKTYYYAETNYFTQTNPQQKLCRYNSGQLIARAWIRAAIPVNAINGFRISGIYPLNPNALSVAKYALSDIALRENAKNTDSDNVDESLLCERIQETESNTSSVPSKLDKMPPGLQIPSDDVESH